MAATSPIRIGLMVGMLLDRFLAAHKRQGEIGVKLGRRRPEYALRGQP
jgi:hypothetical protein